jgi:CheY-like chemotaxis protein
VFLNLLINAAHAIEEGDVEGNEIRVRSGTRNGEVYAEVSDTGTGILPDHLDRLFDPFFTTKDVGVGSGLGLTICHNIVTSCGGRIEVESEPGKGSRFVVRLPAAPPSAREDSPAPDPEPPRREERRLRILVVDDEPMLGSAVGRMLGRAHEMVFAGSGLEGREILERDRAFDVVLCDLMMPDYSGMDLFGWIRKRAPGLARRVVFMTGGAFTPKAKVFAEQVDNPLIEKPFKPEDLMTLFRTVMGEA